MSTDKIRGVSQSSDNLSINDGALAQDVKAIADGGRWGNFAVSDGAEAEEGPVCKAGAAPRTDAVLALVLNAADPGLLAVEGAGRAVKDVGIGASIDGFGAVVAKPLKLNDCLDLETRR